MTTAGLEGRPQERSLLERLPLQAQRPWVGVAAALGAVVLATLIRFALPLEGGFPFVTFLPMVIVIAFLFGVRPGILTLAVSTASAVYFFVPPPFAFRIAPASWLAVFFFVGTCALGIFLIHWMQAAHRRLSEERRRSAALAENRELLFRELQHRVSNNLQVVAALLALQKRHITDEDARAAIDEASRRLGLIGRIHRQLYDPSGERIGMAPFLKQLAADVIDSAGAGGVALEFEIGEALDLQADAAIPVALIVSEAISNAVEHGFHGREGGTIRVSMARTAAGEVALEIADDGPGLPDEFEPEASASLGLRIAATLARQLGGRFEMVNANGALARLTLPPAAVA
ncbi:MAG TPA: histidine kinase dimerization/phosphoacceptor domain -containing protein [Allosphingosinicella sp.]|jgi:two-component sensor histidine kinase